MSSLNNFLPYLIFPIKCFLLWNKNRNCQQRFHSPSAREHEGPILQADILKNLPGLRQHWQIWTKVFIWDFDTTHRGGALASVTEGSHIATASGGPLIASDSDGSPLEHIWFSPCYRLFPLYRWWNWDPERGHAHKKCPATFKKAEEGDTDGGDRTVTTHWPHFVQHVIFVHRMTRGVRKSVFEFPVWHVEKAQHTRVVVSYHHHHY